MTRFLSSLPSEALPLSLSLSLALSLSLSLSVYTAFIYIYIYKHILCICFYTLQAKEFKGWKSVLLRDLHPTFAEEFDAKDNIAISRWLHVQGHLTVASMCMQTPENGDPLNGRKICDMTYAALKDMDAKQTEGEPSFKNMVTACNSFHVCKKTLLIYSNRHAASDAPCTHVAHYICESPWALGSDQCCVHSCFVLALWYGGLLSSNLVLGNTNLLVQEKVLNHYQIPRSQQKIRQGARLVFSFAHHIVKDVMSFQYRFIFAENVNHRTHAPPRKMAPLQARGRPHFRVDGAMAMASIIKPWKKLSLSM